MIQDWDSHEPTTSCGRGLTESEEIKMIGAYHKDTEASLKGMLLAKPLQFEHQDE